jgi:hypothetical protein
MVTIGLFHCPSFLQPGSLAFTPIVADGLLVEELGCRLKVSPFLRRLTRAIPPNRVHGQAHPSLFVTDWQFASSCSPRSDFSAAVTFSYRPVDSDLTGTPTPLQRLLRSRTTAPTAVGSGDLLAHQSRPTGNNDQRNWLALVAIRWLAGVATGGRQVNRPANGALSKPVC